MKNLASRYNLMALVWLALSLVLWQPGRAAADGNNQFFPQTGHTVSGKFLDYWNAHGGLPVYGFPITDAQNEVDPETGKTFLTQWFERNRFELHPENQPPYDVELGLLGNQLRREAKTTDPDFLPNSAINYDPNDDPNPHQFFAETGHNLSGGFLAYWNAHGGLAQFGFPIDEPHYEVDPSTNQTFLMQWFERARFEYHPENQPPNNIELGLLGNQLRNGGNGGKPAFVWKIGTGTNQLVQPAGIAVNSQGDIYVTDYANSHIRKYSPSGQLLYQWGLSGVVFNDDPSNATKGQFTGPDGLAIDSQGNIFVLDRSNNRVQVFDKSEQLLTKWGNKGGNSISSANGQFNEPEGIALDGNGNVYIADSGNNRIQKLKTDGTYLSSWGITGTGNGQFNDPIALAVDGSGNVYVADHYNNRIQKFDGNGNFVLTWGSKGSDDGKFIYPAGIAVDKQGFVYVSDTSNHRIQKFDGNGQHLANIGSLGNGDGQLYYPENLTLDPAGNIYIADTYNRRVQKFGPDGTFLMKIPGADNNGQFFGPYSTTVDNQGSSYVLETVTGKVQKFDAQGHWIRTIGGTGGGDGQFLSPYSIAVDSQNNLYVADTNNHRIQKFDSNGNLLAKYGTQGSGDGQFNYPYAIAIDSQGNMYVNDAYINKDDGKQYDRLQKLDSNGTHLETWNRSRTANNDGSVPFTERGIAVDAQGDIYLTDTRNSQLFKLVAGSQDFNTWGIDPTVKLDGPKGIAVDKEGNVYVCDDFNRRIIKYNGAGQVLSQLGNGTSSADGQFIRPQGIAVDNQDNIYVTDTYSERLIKFRQP